MGLSIEMDDFGVGYSSLGNLTNIPLDALKMDMAFLRSAFKPGGDTGLIRIVLELARYLGVPAIAEGVETEEQLRAMQELKCPLA